MQQLVVLVVSFIVLSILFGLVEKLAPAIQKPSHLKRREFGIDLIYWFFNPLVTRAISGVCIGIVVFFVVGTYGVDFEQMTTTGFGPVAQQPMWLIIVQMVLLGDLIGYWVHRGFHAFPDLWDVHAIHHSSEDLDWFSAVRIHPLNDIISKTIRVIPFALLGFPLTALAAYVPFLVVMAIFLHTNVNLRLGPLKYFIATPHFHRWHHTSAEEGRDKNFAGIFPLYDWLFGTLYLPDEKPTEFGVPDKIPSSFLKQLVYPFSVDRTAERKTALPT